MKSLPDTSTHDQQWKSNSSLGRPVDLKSNALSIGTYDDDIRGDLLLNCETDEARGSDRLKLVNS